MEIQLLGALDYKKVEEILEDKIPDKKERDHILEEIKKIEVARKSEIVASAGRLSRAAGTVLEIIGLSENKTFEQNINFTSKVIGMGHDSISDHDYCVFAIKDVSPIVEQTIIEERFASFTIKSRREVDFSQVGYYIPDFHDEMGNIHPNNEQLKKEYCDHMQMLFDTYTTFKNKGIPIEDARFVLPYCYHSNIIMGMDAHSLKDLIIKLTKTKYSQITELKELGEHLYSIAKENIPYIIPEIDRATVNNKDAVETFLNNTIYKEDYEIIAMPKLINYSSKDIDDSILVSAIMRRYQYSEEKARNVLEQASAINPMFKQELMKKIAFETDGKELTQINFHFSIPVSLAVLTHLTRHRTHHILPPAFVPNIDLEQYKIPPLIKKNTETKEMYDSVYALTKEIYNRFKEQYGVREEDLVYYTLSGNMVNIITNIDGKTLKHILGLRECTKSQWETRKIAEGLHAEISRLPGTQIYETLLGPSCLTEGVCHEGKECCGKIYTIQKNIK